MLLREITPLTRLEKFTRASLLATAFLFTSGFAVVGLVALLVATVVEGLVTRRIPWQRSPADTALLAFTAAFLLIGIASPYPKIAVGAAILSALTLYVAFGPLYRLLRQDRTFLRPFLWSWVGGGFLTAGWAVAGHRLTGHLPVTPLITTSLGTTLLITLVFSLGMSLATPTRWRLLTGVSAAVTAVGLILTYSRGAWLGGIVAIAVLLALTRPRFAVPVVSTILLATIAAAVLTGANMSSVTRRLDGIFSVAANKDRVILARAAIATFLDHPVLGTGLDTFSLVPPRYMSDLTPRAFAHNIFLNMAAEGGTIGLVAFLAVVLAGLRSGWRWLKGASSLNDRAISASIFSAFIGLLVREQFDGTMMMVNVGAGFWLLIAMQVAFAPQEETAMARELVRPRRAQVDRETD